MSQTYKFDKQREKALERDDHECRFCGVSDDAHREERGRGLDVHHIIKDEDDGSNHYRNLISVCRDCHTTLEHTQADALSRIKEEHSKKWAEERDWQDEKRKAEIRRLEKELEDEKQKAEQVFAWFDQYKIEFHILLTGLLDPEIELYKNREVAAEAYAESDETARLESKQLNFAEMASKSLRYTSTGNVDMSISEVGQASRFRTIESPKVTDYMSDDIPDELMESS